MGTVDLVAAAREVRAVVEAHADEGERIRRLPAATVAALTDAGLMRMCVPAAYGGPDVDPATLVEAIEAVAVADGAAGWCTMIAATTSTLANFLPPPTAQEIYGDPATITGGVAAPNGTATPDVVDGRSGYRLTGRWAWGSGTQHCQWILGGARSDGAWRFCFVPGSAVTFHDTWFTGGMRGSGSLDYSVEDLFVPAERTLEVGAMRPQVDGPAARFPTFTLLAVGVAAVGLGVARRALDELIGIAQGKRPQFSSRTLAESAFTQVELARAEARLRAARAFLLDELGAAWSLLADGEGVPVDRRVTIRLAAAHAAEVAVDAADAAYTLAGGTAVYDTSVLGRCLRDAHVVTQHIQTAPKLHEPLGRALLGLDVDTTMF
jgi:alkylation response protein AidB-like acyl-CoA dehydrogenase